MKDYKTLTREKVDVEPGAARYRGETHMMEDWSDKMIDLVLNGPTLNGFKKDELRAILRQTYAASPPSIIRFTRGICTTLPKPGAASAKTP